MAIVREPGSEIIGQFAIPLRGTWRNTGVETVPPDAVYNSSNVFVFEGRLRSRPGLQSSGPNMTLGDFDNILTGAMVVNATGNMLLAGSTTALHVRREVDGIWFTVPATTNPLAQNNIQVTDIAFLETSSVYVALFANSFAPLRRYIYPTDATVQVVTGTNIPSAKSICIAASRVIALVAPHTVVWSRSLNYQSFDTLAVAKRAQTLDIGVCVRSLSALSFVLYKENSIHLARAQAGLSEATAFAFSEPITVEGPAGIFAVVDVNGTHFYMTRSGRIAIFDGTNYPTWIADGIWLYIQGDMDISKAYLIRGVYDYKLNIVIFYYPRLIESFNGAMTGMVVINLPFPGFEAQEGLRPYCFPGISARAVTHAYTKRFTNEVSRAFIYTAPLDSDSVSTSRRATHDLFELPGGDDNRPYTSFFQTGLQSAPDARHVQTTIETFLARGGSGTVTIAPVTSNMLEDTGTIHTADAQTINLAQTPVNEYIGFNKKTRFFGFRYTWSTPDRVSYAGTVVYDSVKRRK